MVKLNKNQQGFSAVEGLLILVIIALIAGVGYLVYKNHKKTTDNTTSTVSTTKPSSAPTTKAPAKTVDPYAGWKTYTLAKEKLSFKYPSSWTLKDNPDSNNDQEVLTGSGNFQMTIGAGADVSAVNFPFGGSSVIQADPVTFNDQSAYLDIWTDEGASSSSVYSVWLSQSKTQAHSFFPSKNITANASNSSVIALIDYEATGSDKFTNEPLSYVTSDANYKDAKLIVQSMAY